MFGEGVFSLVRAISRVLVSALRPKLASAASPREPLASRARPSTSTIRTAVAAPSPEVLIAGSMGSPRRHLRRYGSHRPAQDSSGSKGKHVSRPIAGPVARQKLACGDMLRRIPIANLYMRGSPSQNALTIFRAKPDCFHAW